MPKQKVPDIDFKWWVIAGVYHAVSPKYLQSYLNEYTFRYNHRKDEKSMFKTILSQITTS